MTTGIIFTLIVGIILGAVAGSIITTVRDNQAHYHDALFLSLVVAGNVSIGSLGTPKGIAFDAHSGQDHQSSMLSGNGPYHYQVHLAHFQDYGVTIFYQDSIHNWQQCPAQPRTFNLTNIFGSQPETQNFSC
jgi:hypothetical protein